MPVIINTGGDIRLPMMTFRRGATMADPGAWARARKHPAVVAHLNSGRLVIQRSVAPKPAEPVKAPASLGLFDDKAPSPPASAIFSMTAREAIAKVQEMDLAAVEAVIDLESRKTVQVELMRRALILRGQAKPAKGD